MDQLDEVRSKIDVVQLVSEYLPLQKSGRNFKALCPFHAEKSPSFIVSPERQIWKCFGCQAGGDVFGFLMRMEGMEFGEALRALAKRAGVRLLTYKPTQPEAEKEKLWRLNHLVSEFYHFLLVSHPVGKNALDYLLNRGVQKTSIQLFKLGYAPPFLGILQKFLVGKKGYDLKDVEKTGLVLRYQGQSRDFFRERIIFPLKDHRGNVVGFSGRFIGTWKSEEAAKTGPKYLNIPETLVYHKGDLLYGLETTKKAIGGENQAIIVEGEFDLISSYQTGVQNVVAIKGSALTENHLRLLKRFSERIILALDRDLAGDAAARRGVEMAESFGLDIQMIRLPQSKDPDELAQKDPEAWKKAVKEAIPIYDFYLESALSRFDPQTVLGQKKISEELLPIFAKINNEIIKARYLRLLAQRLQTTEEAVTAQMKKVVEKQVVSYEPQKEGSRPERQRREVLEEYLLALFFQADRPGDLLTQEAKKMVITPALKRILSTLEAFLQTEKKFVSEKFAQTLPPELHEIFNLFYLVDIGERINEKKWFEQESRQVLIGLEKTDLHQKLQEASAAIGRLEKEGNSEEFQKAKETFSSLSRQLGKLRG